jgi:hypothetical protein
MFPRIIPQVRRYFERLREGLFIQLQGATIREQERIRMDLLPVKELMPLLMKPRNGQRWTPEDRTRLRAHIRGLARVSPYFLVLRLPGSFFLFSPLAWFLDRRRIRRCQEKIQVGEGQT